MLYETALLQMVEVTTGLPMIDSKKLKLVIAIGWHHKVNADNAIPRANCKTRMLAVTVTCSFLSLVYTYF